MKLIILVFSVLILHQSMLAQEVEKTPNFYLGASYGTSFSIGNFKDTDRTNPDAGFAKNGKKLDLYCGFPIYKKITLTGTFRYQTFKTKIEDLIETYNSENPSANFTGSADKWKVYYLLIGITYQVNITKKIDFLPRFAFGSLLAKSPGMTISAPNGNIANNFVRNSETGFGMGYEIGIGFQRDLGKHFSLMPAFTFSGGVITIPDVITIKDDISVKSDYQPRIQSFNLGLSLAYRFY